jgi:hypothetical protein
LVSHEVFEWMTMEFYGLEGDCVYLRIRLLGKQSFVKLMSQLILFILAALRCIWISNRSFGGLD